MKAFLLSVLLSMLILSAFAQSYVTALPVGGVHLSEAAEEKVQLYRDQDRVYLQLRFPKDMTQRIGEIFSDNLRLRSKMQDSTAGWKVKDVGYRFNLHQGVLEVHIQKNVIPSIKREQMTEAMMEAFFVLEIKLREDEL
ncbi:MAG: hypothetical protein AB8G22_15195 [Saprospiraceae bacterium]